MSSANLRGSRGGAGLSGTTKREELRERTDNKFRTDASAAGAAASTAGAGTSVVGAGAGAASAAATFGAPRPYAWVHTAFASSRDRGQALAALSAWLMTTTISQPKEKEISQLPLISEE